MPHVRSRAARTRRNLLKSTKRRRITPTPSWQGQQRHSLVAGRGELTHRANTFREKNANSVAANQLGSMGMESRPAVVTYPPVVPAIPGSGDDASSPIGTRKVHLQKPQTEATQPSLAGRMGNGGHRSSPVAEVQRALLREKGILFTPAPSWQGRQNHSLAAAREELTDQVDMFREKSANSASPPYSGAGNQLGSAEVESRQTVATYPPVVPVTHITSNVVVDSSIATSTRQARGKDLQNDILATQSLVDTLQKVSILKWASILSPRRLRMESVDTADVFATTVPSDSSIHAKYPSLPSDRQEFVIRMLNPTSNVWFDMFYVKPSNIPRAGMGLFAAKDYPEDACLGVYFGALTSISKQEYSSCAIRVQRPFGGTMEEYILEQRGIADGESTGSSSRAKGPPPYFGFHFCNDPAYRKPWNQAAASARYNVAIRDDLSVFALKPIAQGEELFLNYNMGDA